MDIRERIIENTTDMFMRYGIKSIRMDDIATSLGISKRTIYEHFEGGREALIEECLDRYYKRLREASEERTKAAANIMEELMMTIDGSDELIRANMNFQADLRRFYPSLFEKMLNKHKCDGLGKFKQRLSEGMKEGLIIPSVNLDFAATVLFDTVHTTMAKPASYQDNNISMEDAFKYIMMYFFRGISTAKGMRIVDELMKKSMEKEI